MDGGGENEAALRGSKGEEEHLAGLGGGITAFNDITKGTLFAALYDLVKEQTREVRAELLSLRRKHSHVCGRQTCYWGEDALAVGTSEEKQPVDYSTLGHLEFLFLRT